MIIKINILFLKPHVFLIGLLLSILVANSVYAVSDTAPAVAGLEEEKEESFATGNEFWDDGNLKGNIFYFQRRRVRYHPEKRYHEVNLDHATGQASLEFESGFINGIAGVDIGLYGSTDARNKGAPDHEMNFEPWPDPWHPNWSKDDPVGGASFYKAHLKFKYHTTWAKIGYFQPSGPGVLGVNWSLLPGTYLGTEIGHDATSPYGDFSTAFTIATEYKAPWFKKTYHLYQNDGSTKVPYLWSLGFRFKPDHHWAFDIGYGESKDYLRAIHAKVDVEKPISAGKIKAGYHLYTLADSDNSGSINDNFDGLAYQHYLYMHYAYQAWTVKGEFTYTRAPMSHENHRGYFVYRLTMPIGSSNGAYGIWWDARSDWNHDREKAFYVEASRQLYDLGLKGWTLGCGYAYGWGGKAYGVEQTLREHAFNANLHYQVQSGRFKNTALNIHWTTYDNKTDLPSWTGFKNAFQDEKDLKIILTIPYSF